MGKTAEIETDESTGWTIISTPFTGIFNDLIEIYIRVEGSNILMSDDGETINNLESIGINFSKSQNRRRILETILLNYGVILDKGELKTECIISDFPKRKHLFLEALIGVNDMFMLSEHNVASVFKDDVVQGDV